MNIHDVTLRYTIGYDGKYIIVKFSLRLPVVFRYQMYFSESYVFQNLKNEVDLFLKRSH